MYASQEAFYAKDLLTPITNRAWRNKLAYGIVTTDDKVSYLLPGEKCTNVSIQKLPE
jgi:hypothetical protein